MTDDEKRLAEILRQSERGWNERFVPVCFDVDFLLRLLSARDATIAEKEREIADIKEIEFPKRVEAVSNGWRKKVEAAEAERDELAAALAAMRGEAERLAREWGEDAQGAADRGDYHRANLANAHASGLDELLAETSDALPARAQALLRVVEAAREALGFLEDMNVVGDLPDTMRDALAVLDGTGTGEEVSNGNLR